MKNILGTCQDQISYSFMTSLCVRTNWSNFIQTKSCMYEFSAWGMKLDNTWQEKLSFPLMKKIMNTAHSVFRGLLPENVQVFPATTLNVSKSHVRRCWINLWDPDILWGKVIPPV